MHCKELAMSEEGEVYEINGVTVIQHGGSIYVTEGGSIYPIQGGNGFFKNVWKKLAPIGKAFKPHVVDVGKNIAKHIVDNEDQIVESAQNKFNGTTKQRPAVIKKPAASLNKVSYDGDSNPVEFKPVDSKPVDSKPTTTGQGIRDSLTPAQRKAFDKAVRESKK